MPYISIGFLFVVRYIVENESLMASPNLGVLFVTVFEQLDIGAILL